jgi:hypothetical protein
MARVAKLSVDLEANSSSLTTALARADRAMSSSAAQWNRSLSQLDRGFQSLTGRVQGLAGGIFSLQGAIGTLLGGAGLLAITRGALEAADGIGKMADRLGLSTTAVQAYQYAAGLAGVSSEQFEAAIRKLNQQIGNGTLRYQDTESALEAIAEQIQATSSGTERARIATEAFGRAGIQLIPMLQGGADGLRAAREEAERLGLVLDEKTIRQAEALNDEMSRLMQVAQRNFQQGLLGGLVRDSEGLRSVYADPAFQQGLRAFGTFVGETLGFVVRNADTIIRTLRALAAVYVGFKVGGAVAGRQGAMVGAGVGAAVAGVVELMSGAADDVEVSVSRINRAIEGVGQDSTTAERTPLDRLRETIQKLTQDVAIAEADLSPALERVARAVQAAGLSIFDDFPADGPIAQAIDELIGLYGRLEAATQRTGTAAEEGTERQARALQKLAEDGADAFNMIDRAAANALYGVESAILDVARGGKDAFKKLVDSILADLARIIIRQSITGPLAAALGGAISSAFGAPAAAPAPVARASGGRVDAGGLYRVGEAGVEMFVPNTSGTVIPNHMLGGGATFAPTFNIDARGSDAATLARARQEAVAISQAAVAQFADQIQRGGSTSRLVGRRA